MGWTGPILAQQAKMKYPTVRDILAGISPGQMENLEIIARTINVPLSDLLKEEPPEAHFIPPHPDHPTDEELIALGSAFARASQGKRLLALYLLTKVDSYYTRAAAIPDVVPLAKVLKKALLSS